MIGATARHRPARALDARAGHLVPSARPVPGAALRRPLSIALLLAPALLAFVLALRPVDNFDLGFHLRIGEHVLTKGIPTTDPFSWPGEGKPWALEQWLGPTAFHLAERAAGLPGVLVLRALVVALAFLLVAFAARTAAGDPVIGAVAALLGVVSAEARFVAQPYVFSLAGLAAVVAALVRLRQRGRWNGLFWLVPLFALWPHVHPGFLTAVAALGAYGAGALAEPWLARRTERLDRPADARSVLRLALVGAACVAAALGSLALLHPLHLGALRKVLSIFSSGVNRASIVEYAALGTSYPITAPMLVLALVPPLVWLARRRGLALPFLVLFVVFVLQAARVGRLVAEASIVLAPVWAHAATDGWRALVARGTVERLRARLSAGLAAGLVLLFAALPAAAHLADPASRALAWPDGYYPRGCYEWIDRANLPAKGFNDLWFGGSFIHHFGERRKVFIDGRSFYSDDFFLGSYSPIKQAAPGWEELARTLGVEWFLLHPERFARLHASLAASGRWAAVHAEPGCVVYVPAESARPAGP